MTDDTTQRILLLNDDEWYSTAHSVSRPLNNFCVYQDAELIKPPFLRTTTVKTEEHPRELATTTFHFDDMTSTLFDPTNSVVYRRENG